MQIATCKEAERNKLPIIRSAAIIAVPALASLLGIVWFRRRRRKDFTSSAIDDSLSSRDNDGVAVISKDSDQCENKLIQVNVGRSSTTVAIVVSDCDIATENAFLVAEVDKKDASDTAEQFCSLLSSICDAVELSCDNESASSPPSDDNANSVEYIVLHHDRLPSDGDAKIVKENAITMEDRELLDQLPSDVVAKTVEYIVLDDLLLSDDDANLMEESEQCCDDGEAKPAEYVVIHHQLPSYFDANYVEESEPFNQLSSDVVATAVADIVLDDLLPAAVNSMEESEPLDRHLFDGVTKAVAVADVVIHHQLPSDSDANYVEESELFNQLSSGVVAKADFVLDDLLPSDDDINSMEESESLDQHLLDQQHGVTKAVEDGVIHHQHPSDYDANYVDKNEPFNQLPCDVVAKAVEDEDIVQDDLLQSDDNANSMEESEPLNRHLFDGLAKAVEDVVIDHQRPSDYDANYVEKSEPFNQLPCDVVAKAVEDEDIVQDDLLQSDDNANSMEESEPLNRHLFDGVAKVVEDVVIDHQFPSDYDANYVEKIELLNQLPSDVVAKAVEDNVLDDLLPSDYDANSVEDSEPLDRLPSEGVVNTVEDFVLDYLLLSCDNANSVEESKPLDRLLFDGVVNVVEEVLSDRLLSADVVNSVERSVPLDRLPSDCVVSIMEGSEIVDRLSFDSDANAVEGSEPVHWNSSDRDANTVEDFVLCNRLSSYGDVNTMEGSELPNHTPSYADGNVGHCSLGSIDTHVATFAGTEDCFADVGFSEAMCFEGSPKSVNTIDANVDMLSEDSGHGGSNDLIVFDTNLVLTHQFCFPSELCGMLIGKDGRVVKGISRRSGAEISVRAQSVVEDFQLVSISGTELQVSRALQEIEEKFPPNVYPHISYENINNLCISPVQPGQIQFTQMFLAEEASLVDVIVSSVVAPDHVFVQQPHSESFQFLEILNYAMQVCYEQPTNNIELPRPILENTVCVAPMFNGWFRAMVVSYFPETDECLVRFVDYGGYTQLGAYLLQQIRSDFTSLPFQAVECYLSDIVAPIDGLPYPEEAKLLMEHLVRAHPLVAQFVGFADDGVACINLFRSFDEKWFSITEELVLQGLARRVVSDSDC